MSNLRLLFRFSRPLNLLLAALTYGLGLGLARYLGITLDVPAAFLGGVLVVLVMISTNYLSEYFLFPQVPFTVLETPRQHAESRRLLLVAGLAFLGAVAVLIISLLANNSMSMLDGLFLVMILLVSLLYAVPPFRLVDRGFGEFLLAVMVADLIPAFGFLLQSNSLHRLLPMMAFPLTALALAYFIVLDFPNYHEDLKYERQTLVMRLGWERAIPLHNILILFAYLLFAAAPLLGFPWRLVWPAFLPLPFSIIQILWLRNISLGGRPAWNFLLATATSAFGLTTYLLTLTFWIR